MLDGAFAEGMQLGSVLVLVEGTFWSDGYSRHLDIYPSLLLAPVRHF